MPLRPIPVVAGTLALAKATALWPALAASPPVSTYQPDCTYNGIVQSCRVVVAEDSCDRTGNTALIYWLDGEVTSVWFLSKGSRQVDGKVILNCDKRGRITQVVPLEDDGQRLHVKSETGNQLSFIVPPPPQQQPNPDAGPHQP